MTGYARLRRIGRWRFPTHELSGDESVHARVGPGGWVKIYLGSGKRISLLDGEHWRLGSLGLGGGVCLIVRNQAGQKVATGCLSPDGTYGINGRDYSLVLTPRDAPRFGRADSWTLSEFDEDVAVIGRHPLSVTTGSPVHLGAILVAFALVKHGLPDESRPRIPGFRWA
jgi:hypothetical protein